MSIHHDGYTVTCEVDSCAEAHESYRESRRGAIKEARDCGFFIGRVRVTSGAKPSSKAICLCPNHASLVLP